MTDQQSLLYWLEERRLNALAIAATKHGADRAGWLEDADYLRRSVEAVSDAAHICEQQAERFTDDRARYVALECAAAIRARRNRQADRERFPDSAFNRWLDEGISDAGHTVWDQIWDVCAAWHGWVNRTSYLTAEEKGRIAFDHDCDVMDDFASRATPT